MRRRAEAGDCPSQCTLGLCYLYGIDMEVDYQEAFRFLAAAAEKGASRAILNLGRMYARGLGIPRDVPEAIGRFETAAALSGSGDAFQARLELGRLYAHGLGVPVDKGKALRWYALALEIATNEDDEDEVKEIRQYVEQSKEA